jgi:aminoglycoside phosphotransferase (APT) family kinase protein
MSEPLHPDPRVQRVEPVADPPDDSLVDREALARYLRAALPDFRGPFGVERLGEGQSCLTYLITGDGWELVLRRPPRGDLPPTAFDVTREYRVMRALRDTGTPVPVPSVLALCEDREVIGAPFYLMERVDGDVVRGELPRTLSSPRDCGSMAERLLDTLVALRRVDPVAAGLERFGKPDGYLERQLWRMRGLWDMARFRDIPEIDQLSSWLATNLPSQEGPAIVHGDYKLDNVIFAPHPPVRLVAVVDWEMSTLGDPLADLGWLLYFWRDPGDPELGLRVATVTDREGFPRRRELLERYASLVQPTLDENVVRWYVALAGWKIAIIMEGSYRRYLAGVGDHPAFALLKDAVPALARRANEAARGAMDV